LQTGVRLAKASVEAGKKDVSDTEGNLFVYQKLKESETDMTKKDVPVDKKAILSNLYHKKSCGSCTYPWPTTTDLICQTSHHRTDTRVATWFEDLKSKGLWPGKYPQKIEAKMIGAGFWKAYGSQNADKKPWTHAKITTRAQAVGLLKMAADGLAPKDGVMKHEKNGLGSLQEKRTGGI